MFLSQVRDERWSLFIPQQEGSREQALESVLTGCLFFFFPFDRASLAGQSYNFQLGPAGIVDPLDRGVAIQNFMDHPVSGRDRRSVRPGHSQNRL